MRLKRYIFRRNIRNNIRAVMEALERENRELRKKVAAYERQTD